MKREFPFRARVNGSIIVVTGLHHTGACFTTQGHGLVPLSVVPVEEAQEVPRIRVESAAIEPELTKQWTRRGFFKDKPLPRRVVKLRAETARNWLRATLTEPIPAREVLQMARAE